jgi:MoaA/NifB/PqqE/SkfB family radical SAM enzyme
MLHRYHPLQVQIVPMRRCNLACGYCNEYDKTSEPVALEEMLKRVDHIADLGTASLTISGGEPLLHPQLDAILTRVRERGMVSGLITNGFLLGPDRIKRLNDTGLDILQISIDNVEPDKVSQKSLRTLDKKLEHLAQHANFDVVINSVLGAAIKNPEDARTVANRARQLGFQTSVGIIHDSHGRLKRLNQLQLDIFNELSNGAGNWLSQINGFQKNLVEGKPNDWQCRAGARYLYICEDGLVHYCSQQRGNPGTPLAQYTHEDMRRHYHTPKPCAPFCTINCVQRSSYLDQFPRPQVGTWVEQLTQLANPQPLVTAPLRAVQKTAIAFGAPLRPRATGGKARPRTGAPASASLG